MSSELLDRFNTDPLTSQLLLVARLRSYIPGTFTLDNDEYVYLGLSNSDLGTSANLSFCICDDRLAFSSGYFDTIRSFDDFTQTPVTSIPHLMELI